MLSIRFPSLKQLFFAGLNRQQSDSNLCWKSSLGDFDSYGLTGIASEIHPLMRSLGRQLGSYVWAAGNRGLTGECLAGSGEVSQ